MRQFGPPSGGLLHAQNDVHLLLRQPEIGVLVELQSAARHIIIIGRRLGQNAHKRRIVRVVALHEFAVAILLQAAAISRHKEVRGIHGVLHDIQSVPVVEVRMLFHTGLKRSLLVDGVPTAALTVRSGERIEVLRSDHIASASHEQTVALIAQPVGKVAHGTLHGNAVHLSALESVIFKFIGGKAVHALRQPISGTVEGCAGEVFRTGDVLRGSCGIRGRNEQKMTVAAQQQHLAVLRRHIGEIERTGALHTLNTLGRQSPFAESEKGQILRVADKEVARRGCGTKVGDITHQRPDLLAVIEVDTEGRRANAVLGGKDVLAAGNSRALHGHLHAIDLLQHTVAHIDHHQTEVGGDVGFAAAHGQIVDDLAGHGRVANLGQIGDVVRLVQEVHIAVLIDNDQRARRLAPADVGNLLIGEPAATVVGADEGVLLRVPRKQSAGKVARHGGSPK